MAEEIEDDSEAEAIPRHGARWLLASVGVAALVLGGVWLARHSIADHIIADQLAQRHLPATYSIERIDADSQVLRNVVVGNPQHPDFTAEQIFTHTNLWRGTIEKITIVRPRFYGAYRKGRFSFGSLDPLLFGPSSGPFRLPDLNLALVDGRGRIESDFGPVGVKFEGEGPLRHGFAGIIAAVAPRLALQGCMAKKTSLFGRVTINQERPYFNGPLRFGGVGCRAGQLALGSSTIEINASADRDLAGGEAQLAVNSSAAALANIRGAELRGTAALIARGITVNGTYNLATSHIAAPYVHAAEFGLKGSFTAPKDWAQIVSEGEVYGRQIVPAAPLLDGLRGSMAAAQGTLAAPLLAQFSQALARESSNSTARGQYSLRHQNGSSSLSLANTEWRGTSGASLLRITDFSAALAATGGIALRGAFDTGGPGLPQISGQITSPSGRIKAQLVMADYQSGRSHLALPAMTLVQSAKDSLTFTGKAELSGAIPSGSTEALHLPVNGTWSAARGVRIWPNCVPLSFDRLALARLTLEHRSLTLCPQGGGAIVSSGGAGLKIAAGLSRLDLAGHLGSSPIQISGGALGLAYPGTLAARNLDIALGKGDAISRFHISGLNGQIKDNQSGTFTGMDMALASVPLNLFAGAGQWRYAGGVLSLSKASFRLEDRQKQNARFLPLFARDASLKLADSVITATAEMREAKSDRVVGNAAIRHSLTTGVGHADLTVPGIQFDKQLQPDGLTYLALGVIANAKGSVNGSGVIDWSPKELTSSGQFATPGLDFAAAFGPVKGMTGTVHFTDLLGLVTAPDQLLHIASINPGIAVENGALSFALQPQSQLAINGAQWPFMEGTLRLLPTHITLGTAETRRFELEVRGANATRFVQQMDMGNLAASGIFDGRLPLVFDENGGRIDGGLLTSRPPGGNVAYVGPLSYKDLGKMANFAFQSLRSLDYHKMTIRLEGNLGGEMLTKLRFDGVSQGKGTKQNFITRQLARLPIQMNVNIRAPFFGLLDSYRATYDQNFLRGIVRNRLQNRIQPKATVQPPVSETKP